MRVPPLAELVTLEEFGRVNYCSSSISTAVINCSDRRQLRGERVYLSHNSKLHTIIVGKSRQGLETASYITSKSRERTNASMPCP